MEPLKITFELAQPMAVPDYPIHFDALMCWAVEKRELLGIKGGEVPIAIHREGDDWCYMASQLLIRLGGEGIRFQGMMTRRYELSRWALTQDHIWSGNKNVIPDGTGHQKAFLVHDSYIMPESIHCFCVGDRDGIFDLMDEITGLGRRTRNGWGKLRGYQIEAIDAAECHWFKRALPGKMKEVSTELHHPAIGNFRYPYWNRENWSEILEFTGHS